MLGDDISEIRAQQHKRYLESRGKSLHQLPVGSLQASSPNASPIRSPTKRIKRTQPYPERESQVKTDNPINESTTNKKTSALPVIKKTTMIDIEESDDESMVQRSSASSQSVTEAFTKKLGGVSTQLLQRGIPTDPRLDWLLGKSPSPPPSISTECPTQPLEATLEPTGPNAFRLLTWNLDGLDPHLLLQRTRAIGQMVKELKPDVVCFQEVIHAMIPVLSKALEETFILIQPSSKLSRAEEPQYFCQIWLSRSKWIYKGEVDTIWFPTSEMTRHLLRVTVRMAGGQSSTRLPKICFMTSHLESCKESAGERLTQFRETLEHMRESGARMTIFGGDTNLRDTEVKAIGGLPAGVTDVWETLGSSSSSKFTWDTLTNDNKTMQGFKPRLRFDRLYFTSSKAPGWDPVSLDLIGKFRLPCGVFASDHYGLLCEFVQQEL